MPRIDGRPKWLPTATPNIPASDLRWSHRCSAEFGLTHSLDWRTCPWSRCLMDRDGVCVYLVRCNECHWPMAIQDRPMMCLVAAMVMVQTLPFCWSLLLAMSGRPLFSSMSDKTALNSSRHPQATDTSRALQWSFENFVLCNVVQPRSHHDRWYLSANIPPAIWQPIASKQCIAPVSPFRYLTTISVTL